MLINIADSRASICDLFQNQMGIMLSKNLGRKGKLCHRGIEKEGGGVSKGV